MDSNTYYANGITLMKSYWEIPGPSKSPQSPCIAFNKYDGANLRFEWSKKRGWYKFGSRNILIDHTSEQFGPAIPLFLETLGEPLVEVFKDSKAFRGVDSFIVYCEYCSANSFAGWFPKDEPKELVLIDVNPHKKGFVLPRDFVKLFGHLRSAEVVYEGNFGPEFVQDVREGKYNLGNVKEGVVAKGIIDGKRSNSVHGLWMSKVKTKWWLEELKRKASTDAEFRKILLDNIREQSDG